MSRWLNNKQIIFEEDEIIKPCYGCGYCPYGQLVEEFPVDLEDESYACKMFGHNCPVYYHAELTTEEDNK